MANEFAVKSSLVAEQGEREIAPVVLRLLYHDYLKTPTIAYNQVRKSKQKIDKPS